MWNVVQTSLLCKSKCLESKTLIASARFDLKNSLYIAVLKARGEICVASEWHKEVCEKRMKIKEFERHWIS